MEEIIMNKQVKIVVFVPKSHTDIVRQAMGDAGAGKISSIGWNPFEYFVLRILTIC